MKRNTKAYLFKSIHFVNDDVIELRRSLSDLIVMILSCFLFLLFILIVMNIFIKEEYSDLIYSFYALFYPEKLPLAYLIGQNYENIKMAGVIFIVLPIVLLLCIKFIPVARPIRINRKRRIIYFWSWGKFYIYRIPVQNYQQGILDILPLYFCDKPSGCFIGIPSEDGKKIITRQIGLLSTSLEQKVALKSFLNHYLRYQDGDALYQYKKEKFEYCQRKINLFKKICKIGVYTFKYNEEKTEAAIQKWLATHKTTIRNEKQWQQIKTALEAKNNMRTMGYLILITILSTLMLLRLRNQL